MADDMAAEVERSTMVCYELEPWEHAYLQEHLPAVELRWTAERLTADTASLAEGATALGVFIHSPVGADLLERLPSVRFIATLSTGYDHIDLDACRANGVVVSNVPTYGENTVAEHTFGLILSLSRRIHQAYVRTSRGDFSLDGLRGIDLKGRTLGVMGSGHIGLHVIRIARGFGMDVLAYDVRENPLIAEVLGFSYAPLEAVLRESDIVTLHMPYLPSTHHLMNRERLGQMKRGSILINTARGAIVDTDALLWALDEGIIAGAGLDVVEGEELMTEERSLLKEGVAVDKLQAAIRSHVLLRRDNVVITPHNAFNSEEALRRILDTTVANVERFLAGAPINVVV
jgi:D-lactate dehydrogenase